MATKIVCVVHGDLSSEVSCIPGLRGYAVNLPYPGEASEHPSDVGGVAMVWLDDDAPRRPNDWFPTTPVTAYLVDERVQVGAELPPADGVPTPGIRRISFVRRAPTLTRPEMAWHWSEVHAPLARVHHPALARYVQNVVVEPLTAGAPEVDGIAELHFRTVRDLHERFYDSDDGRAVIAQDVGRFLAREHGWRLLAQETRRPAP